MWGLATPNKKLIKLGFNTTFMHFLKILLKENHHDKNRNIFDFYKFGFKIFYLSLDTIPIPITLYTVHFKN